ncbi:MAG: hypothetical protein ACE5HP_12830 [Gemmatimonadota bacterium]
MEDLIPILGIVFGLGVPVTVLAIRFVIHPMVRDLIGAVKGRTSEREEDLQRRLGRLEEAVHGQGQAIDRLVEAELFRRRLESGPTDAPPVVAREASRPESGS